MSNPKAFDTVFVNDIEKAISYITAYRGIDISDVTRKKLVDAANESLLLYIKSPMNIPAQKAAHSLAKALEKILLADCGQKNNELIQGIFLE